MSERGKDLVAPIATGGVCCLLLIWWLSTSASQGAALRLSGDDGAPKLATASQSTSPRATAGRPIRGAGQPAGVPGHWPGFRGPNRDGIVADGVALARSWPPGGPPLLWSVSLGEGYASPAVANGCVYVLDYDEQAGADTLRCLSLADGQEIWRNSYPVAVTRNHGMSRTVPAVVDDLVITIGPRCHVACWDARTGECRWLMDLVRDHGATEPRWYAGQCPLIDEGRLILAPCGPSLLIAVHCQTGQVIWESPNARDWEMTHASITVTHQFDQRAYVYPGSGGVAAVAAEDGRLLWDNTDWPMTFATCPSPLALPEGRIFLCSGYGRDVGGLMLHVRRDGDEFHADSAFTLTPRQFNSEHHTPIFYNGHIYGVRKRSGGQLVCLDVQGNELWNSVGDRFGNGPYLIADELVLVMDDHGQLTMAEASPEQYQRLASHAVWPDGHDAWGPMVLVDGRLLVRDMTRLACLDLAAR